MLFDRYLGLGAVDWAGVEELHASKRVASGSGE